MTCNHLPEMQLKSQEIHVWSAYLPDNEKDISYFTFILSEDEVQRADNFRSPRDKTSFILARGILRCLLGRYLGLPPQEIEIAYGLWGKPYVAPPSLYFNLSHSRDYVLYAITQSCEVGIDIEYMDPTLDVEGMVLSILSPQELSFWKNVTPDKKINTFFKLWTCKEALLKASGKGWLSNHYTLPAEVLEIIRIREENKETENSPLSMGPVWISDFIPGYASAFFIDDPVLSPVHLPGVNILERPFKI